MVSQWFRNLLAAGTLACAVSIASLSTSSEALAQKDRNASKPTKSGSLESSKRVKYKDKTSVDFDAADIDGSAKSPFGSMGQSRDQGFDKGFIKLRYHWHDQMVMSLSGLSGN